MKILVVSDSHGDNQILKKIVSKYQRQVDFCIHCGDSEMGAHDPLINSFKMVKGNMDYENFPDHQVIKDNPDKILVTHGHLYGVNFDLLKLKLFAESLKANVVLFGHTHMLMADYNDGMLFVNPGSISQPRGKYSYLGGTYAIINDHDNMFQVNFFDRQFNLINNLQFVFKK